MGIGSSSAGTAPPPATPQPQNGGASPPYAPQYPNEPSAHEHQKTVAIKNYANIKKDSLRVEPDEENPGKFVVAFTFNAAAPGSITIMYFTKEDADFNLVATEQDRLLSPVEVPFHKGFDQEFRQACGTGIDFSVFEEIGLTKEEDAEQVYPLVVKAEAHVANGVNSQITHAVFEKKENGEYKVRVMKQILWVDNQRYELLEIFGIEAAGKECIICLSEPRDTVVLPCRHMCMCSGCAKLLRLQTNRCSVCRQPIERLMDINVNNAADGALG